MIHSLLMYREPQLTDCDLGGASFGFTDPEQERDPPPPPTPVTFPTYSEETNLSSTRSWSHDSPPPDLRSLFLRVQRPTDISEQHFRALSIQFKGPCPLEDLLPLGKDGSSYLPALELKSTSTEQADNHRATTESTISSERKNFLGPLVELQVDNDTAFRVITRTTKGDAKPPRLAFMRKFWEGLESMSQYWDTSIDHYYEGEPTLPQLSNGRARSDSINEANVKAFSDARHKKAKLKQESATVDVNDNGLLPAAEAKQAFKDLEGSDPSDMSSEQKTELLERLQQAVKDQSNMNGSEDDSSNDRPNGDAESRDRVIPISHPPSPRPRLRYKGRRTSTGREMPDQFRIETVKSFLDGVVWTFQCSVNPPKRMPIVQINSLIQPVRQTATVCRPLKDRNKARQGWVQGPVMGLQVRAETDFDAEDGSTVYVKGRMDIMRELGGLLQIAQERRREGKTEVKPGEGKWWTTKTRWGGGPGGEVEIEDLNDDVLEALKERVAESKGGNGRASRRGGSGRKTPAIIWKELKCGSGYWDPRTEYAAIGKEPKSEYDEASRIIQRTAAQVLTERRSSQCPRSTITSRS